jgi:phosphoserine aminotransferase
LTFSGIWSKKAADEASKYCKVNQINCVDENYSKLTSINEWLPKLSANSSIILIATSEKKL